MINLKAAKEELEKKSYGEIQEETAWKWASRACASYDNCKSAKKKEKLVYWTVAEEFYHEAIEHAALVEGNDGLLGEIRKAVHPYLEDAAVSMEADPEKVDVI